MTTTVVNVAKNTIAEHLRSVTANSGNNVTITAGDFTKQLGELDCEEEFDFYTREGRGHFRFYTKDGNKLPVSVSVAAMEALPRKLKGDDTDPMDMLEHCLSVLTLRSGVSEAGRDFLSFGVTGEGNLRKGTISLKAFVKAWAGK